MTTRHILAAALCAATFAVQAQDPYKVIVPMSADDEGAMAFIINYDTGAKADSVLVETESATFQGTMDEPFAARLIVDGQRRGQFIMEPGTIAFSKQGLAFGSPLNDKFNEISQQANAIGMEFQKATTEAEQQAIYARYEAFTDSVMKENLDNPIGYMLFLQQAYNMAPEELEAFLAKEPSLKAYKRVTDLVEMNRRKASTGEGAKYKDFTVNGQKLSNYVGKDGKYLLVDFWASWCGPCRREIPVIKEIYEANKDKLNVLGVAVWDEVPDTERAIKELGITWPVILDGQRIPTDIYGISGIPCIILIAPDGTIVSRDKQDEELKAAVANALK